MVYTPREPTPAETLGEEINLEWILEEGEDEAE